MAVGIFNRLKGRPCDTYKTVLFAGDYQFHAPRGFIEALIYCCPNCGSLLSVVFNRWKWNGNIKRPTITPNMKHNECGGLYRLTNGFWVKLVDDPNEPE